MRSISQIKNKYKRRAIFVIVLALSFPAVIFVGVFEPLYVEAKRAFHNLAVFDGIKDNFDNFVNVMRITWRGANDD